MTLDKSEWVVRGIDHDEAQRLIRIWHYSRDHRGASIYEHGLFRRDEGWFGGRCYGAAAWMNAIVWSKRFGLPSGALMLVRLVVDPEAPKMAAGFLLAHSMKLVDRQAWPVLVTYADTFRGHEGTIYKATNWTYDGDGGGEVYIHPTTGRQISSLGPKGHFLPCPEGWRSIRSIKRRFIHVVPYDRQEVAYSRAVAASSDAPGIQPGEGGSQPTLPLQSSLFAAEALDS